MTTRNWILTIIESVLWYFFFFYLLYCIHNTINLYVSAGILLALFYAASMTCPWVRSTDAWQKVWKS